MNGLAELPAQTDTSDSSPGTDSTIAPPPGIQDFENWRAAKDPGSPDLFNLKNVTPDLGAAQNTRWISGKPYKVVGTVPAEQAPSLRVVGKINDTEIDPTAIVDHDPDLAYSLFQKQHENDKVTPLDVVSAPMKFIWGTGKGIATGLPKFLKSAYETAGDVGVVASSASRPEEKTKAANELMGGALSGTQSALDLLHGGERNVSAFASLITGGLIGSRDKDLSKDDVISLLQSQAKSRKLQEAIQRGDLKYALKYAGAPDSVADRAYTPEQLKEAGYSGERAVEMGMTMNPVNFAPFGKLVPAGVGGALLSGAGKAMRYSGSLLDNPFVKWSTYHASPVYAALSALQQHWTPAVASALSMGLPAAGRALKAGGAFAEEAGMGLTSPEDAAMLSQVRDLGGVPEGAVRQGAKRAIQAGAVGGAQMLPFTLGAQSPEEAGEMFGFGVGAGMFHMGMREAWKNGALQLSGGKPLNLSGQSRIYGVPDDALHAQATANMSKEDVEQVNRERHGMQGVGQLFILPEDVFDQRAGDATASAKGAGYIVRGGETPTVYYRGESGFRQAKAHEAIHLVSDMLTPGQKAEIYAGLQKQNDVSKYATRYYSDLYKEPIKVDFDSLPDKEPNPQDKYGMTKENVMEEIMADMLSRGKSFSDITQNPDIIRSLQLGAGKMMERLGLQLTANETGQIRGVNPSYRAISIIETMMRKTAKDAARSGATYGQAIPDPETYFQDLRKGLSTMGYARGEATTLAESVIEEAKDMNRPAGLDDLFRRALTGKWPEPVKQPAVVAKPSEPAPVETTVEPASSEPPAAPIPAQPESTGPAPVAQFEAQRQTSNPEVAAMMTKEETTALHRAIDAGQITDEASFNDWITNRTKGQRGEMLRTVKTLQDSQKPFTVTFTKADGSTRTMKAQFGVQKDLKGGKKSTAGNPALYTVMELNEKGEPTEYRTFDLDRVQSIEGEGGKFEKQFMPRSEEPSDKITSQAIMIADIPFRGRTWKEAKEAAIKFGYKPEDVAKAQLGFVTQKGAFLSQDQASDFGTEHGQFVQGTEEGPLRARQFKRERQFMPQGDPELVTMGNGLTPEENKRYLEIKSKPEPTTQEADEFSALIDKMNAHTESEGEYRRANPGAFNFVPSGPSGLHPDFARDNPPEKYALTPVGKSAERIAPERFYAAKTFYGPEIIDRLTGERHTPDDEDTHISESVDAMNKENPPLPESWPNVTKEEVDAIVNPPPQKLNEFKMAEAKKWDAKANAINSQIESLVKYVRDSAHPPAGYKEVAWNVIAKESDLPEIERLRTEQRKAISIYQRLATEAGTPDPLMLHNRTIDFMPRTDAPEHLRDISKELGLRFEGESLGGKALAFTDDKTGSTTDVPIDATPEVVREMIETSRKAFRRKQFMPQGEALSKDEFAVLRLPLPEGGSSLQPFRALQWRIDKQKDAGAWESLHDIANYDDQFRIQESLGKGWEHEWKPSLQLLNKIKKDEPITVYRAAPKDRVGFLPGSYVSESKQYVKLHGDRILEEDYEIREMQVKPSELEVLGDPHEFRYIPESTGIAYQRYLDELKPTRFRLPKP